MGLQISYCKELHPLLRAGSRAARGQSKQEVAYLSRKCKGKVHPVTGHDGPEGEWRYSSTLSLTLALHVGGWSASHPGRSFPPGKTRYPLYRVLGGHQGRSGQVRKISSHRDSIPRPSSPSPVTVLITLPGTHLGMMLTNCMLEEIKISLNSGIASFHSDQNLLFSHLQIKNIKI